jgi:hypothetical protein
MANFNHLRTCLNAGDLTVPPVPSLAITGASGGTITFLNPAAATNYNLNLPSGAGTVGQFLTSGGPGGTLTWTSSPSLNPPPLVDGNPVGRPAGSSFAWVNQGSASYTEHTNGPITLSVPAQSGDQLRGIGIAPPGSTPYTLTVKLGSLLWGRNFYVAGIYIRDSTGKMLTMAAQATVSTAPQGINVTRWNSTTSFNATQKSKEVTASATWWFRVTNNGANWNFYISPNGADWISYYSEGSTAFLGSTISDLGVYGDNNDTASIGLNSLISIWSYELATGAGTNSHW